jgi:hypothetical protein
MALEVFGDEDGIDRPTAEVRAMREEIARHGRLVDGLSTAP